MVSGRVATADSSQAFQGLERDPKKLFLSYRREATVRNVALRKVRVGADARHGSYVHLRLETF